jgi:hypothetical protein
MRDEHFLANVDVNDTIPVDEMLHLNQNGLKFRAVGSNYSVDIYFDPLQVIALDNVTAWMIDEALSEQMQINYWFANGSVVGNETLFATSNASFISIAFPCSSLPPFSGLRVTLGSVKNHTALVGLTLAIYVRNCSVSSSQSKCLGICFNQKI